MRFATQSLVCILILILLFFSATPLLAQGLGGTTATLITDIVDEAGLPLSGVHVTVSGTAGNQVNTTGKDGRSIFPYLVPGSYNVQVELSGYGTVQHTGVRLRLGHRIILPVTLRKGVQEEVPAAGESPWIDTTSCTIGANISSEEVKGIPLRPFFASYVNLVPGVSDSGIPGIPHNVSIEGSSGLENTYIIDGVNITDPGYGSLGAFSRFYGSLGTGFQIDMVTDVEVMTGAFEPEYGQALGGVVNVLTRSGGNNLHGSAYVYFTPDQLEGDNKLVELQDIPVVNVDHTNAVNGGVNAGGAIVKDKLFFFGAYNRIRWERTFLNDPRASSYEEFPTTNNIRYSDSYAAKLTANLSRNHTLEFSAFGDPSRSELGLQDGIGLIADNPMTKRSELEYGSNSQAGRWNALLRQDMFLEAQIAHSHNKFVEIPGPEGNQWAVRDRTGPVATVSGGLGAYDLGSDGSNWQYSFKLTNLWKRHEFRYGVQFEDIDYSGGIGISGPTLTLPTGQQSTTGVGVVIYPGRVLGLSVDKIYLAGTRISPSPIGSTTHYLNWFAQDSWNITPHLSAELGIRWEQQQFKANQEGTDSITLTNNWAPRLGIVYDYLRNGKSKMFFHFGRYFEKIPSDLVVRALPLIINYSQFFFDPELTQPIPGTALIGGQKPSEVEGHGSSTSPFEMKAQYANEWVVGMEQQLSSDLSIGARFLYRDVNRVIEDITLDLSVPCVPMGGICVPPEMRAEDFLTHEGGFLLTNLDGHYPGSPEAIRHDKALELTVEKRFHHNWHMFGSWRIASLTGNYEGLFRRDNGQSDPNVTSFADFAPSPFLGFTYDEGPLPNDIRHMVKLFGSYETAFGLTMGAAINFQTGRPITELGFIPGYSNRDRLLTPRGAIGRTDSITTVDLHVDYAIGIGKTSQQISVGMDLFNVFNAQSVVAVYESSEIGTRTFIPLPGHDFLKPIQYQYPRSFQLFLRYSL